MEAVPALEARGETPPLAAARLRRQLTVESAAKLARLTPDEVTWLEEGRLYRFPSSDSALLALLLYSTGLGIGRREARRLAGLPLVARPRRDQVRQLAGVMIGVVLALAAVGAFLLPGLLHDARKPTAASGTALPPTWRVAVDVLNGSGDMNYTRSVASRIGALAYRIERVTRADRFDYPQTAVYFHPGGERLAERLARQLGVSVRPLPGGGNPSRLVVVVGPARI
ncbi:MAG: LytR C-terminal domain-containing protein [Actinomycetota bacterium]|nr:LytR C-terminal domain-containing protein [Actinomycetota bacterium]